MFTCREETAMKRNEHLQLLLVKTRIVRISSQTLRVPSTTWTYFFDFIFVFPCSSSSILLFLSRETAFSSFSLLLLYLPFSSFLCNIHCVFLHSQPPLHNFSFSFFSNLSLTERRKREKDGNERIFLFFSLRRSFLSGTVDAE